MIIFFTGPLQISYNQVQMEQGKEKVFLIVNLRNRAVDYTLPAGVANTSWTNALSAGNVSPAGKETLQLHAYLILKNH